jgi:transglutaminase-like putative cysteine protease
VALALLASGGPALAGRDGPTLHEVIPADPKEDVAMGVALDGDLPAAIHTPRGLVSAPDPARPTGNGSTRYNASGDKDSPGSEFRPDSNTKRPDVLPYDDPFTPSTAPFKRLSAFDTVKSDFTLEVADKHASPLSISAVPPPQSTEEAFYGDMVIDLAAGKKVRIPSVGPGARILHARAGIGTQDVRFTLYKDGAENWFIEGDSNARVRLVMQLAIQRAAFGGEFGNPTRAELRTVPTLPANVQASALVVQKKIGVTSKMAPRDIVSKLVAYFRAFQDSDEPPQGQGDIYLDLALSQKGVCRHRSFAFMITALSLGIPTRVVMNEAHAWVEVNDGRMWRRIDLGGAGRMLHDPLSQNVPYEPPPDPFAWPQGSTRGQDLGDRARTGQNVPPSGQPNGGSPSSGSSASPAGAGSGGPTMIDPNKTSGSSMTGQNASGTKLGSPTVPGAPDERPGSAVTMTFGTQSATADAHRGAPLQVRGQVTAEGEPCGHVTVEIVLSSRRNGEIPVGVLATDEHGNYDGALVLPASVPLGDYEAKARTLGDSRCGKGQTK